MVVIKVLEIVGLAVFVISNVYVAKEMSAKEMYREFVKGQCLVGKICANIFYAPAWAMKVLKAAITIIIA